MESKDTSYKTVQFKEKQVHFTTDSEVESDREVSIIQNQSTNSSKSSTAVRCSSGDMNSVSSISTSILDDAEEVKILKDKLAEREVKCKYLEGEVHKMKIEVANEKSRTEKLEKKLQFVKDNQEVFMRLKEAYINMKYNEAAGRKMIEIREKGIQTWEGILCKGCIAAEEMRREVENLKESYNDSFIVRPMEMEQVMNTVKYLKDLIERREKTWSLGLERENILQNNVKILENENLTLRELLKSRQYNTEEGQFEETLKSSDQPFNRETVQLKKIIIKFEKWLRELEKSNTGFTKFTLHLNDKEKKIVQQIMTKYNSKLHKKSTEKFRSRSVSSHETKDHLISCPETRSSCPKLKHLKKEENAMSSNSHFKITQQTDNAITIMDYLFDSPSEPL